MSHRRNGLRKQVTAKQGPSEVRREKEERGVGRKWEEKEREREREREREQENKPWGNKMVKKGERFLCRESRTGSLILRPFIWRCQGRNSIEYSSDFLMCLLRAVVSTDWPMPGQGSLVTAAGPDVNHGVVCLIFLLFWAWS